MIGGRYEIPKGTPITVLTPMLHRDPASGAPTPRSSTRTTWRRAKLRAVPPNAYKPFGTGQRACIGRQFALQEAVLVLGMVLQRFEFIDYARLRAEDEDHADRQAGRDPDPGAAAPNRPLDRAPAAAPASPYVAAKVLSSPEPATRVTAARHGTPLTVLFGSNLGTAEGLATNSRRRAPIAASTSRSGRSTSTSAPAGRTVRRSSSARPTTGPRPTTRTSSAKWVRDPETATDAWAGVVVLGVRVRQHRVGGDLPGRTHAARRRSWRRTARPGCTRGARATPGSDFDAQYRDWHAGLWTDVADALDLPADVAERRERPARASRSRWSTGRSPTR